MYLPSRAAPCPDIAVRSVEEISQGLDLAGLGNPYILHECSATTGVGKSLALGIRQWSLPVLTYYYYYFPGVTEALHMLAAQLNKMAPTAPAKGPVPLD
jgi:hypothetical protein